MKRLTCASKFQWNWPDTKQNRESFQGTRMWRATYGRDWAEDRSEHVDCYIQLRARGRLRGKCVAMQEGG